MLGGKPNPSGRARPLRVLHFVSTFAVKTDTKLLARMAPHVDRSQCEWSFACFYDSGPMRSVFETAGCETFNLDLPSQFDPRAIFRAQAVIDRVQPDVVHTHLLRADLMAGMAARLSGVGTIVGAAYAIGAFRRERRRFSDPLLDSTCARLPTDFIAVCRAAGEDWQMRLGIDPTHIHVIHTGVDTAPRMDRAAVQAFRDAHGANDETPLVLTVARLSYEKGIDTLIEAAARMKSRGVSFRWVIVGDGADRAQVERTISAAGLADEVRLAGFMPDVWPAMAATDVICIPSKCEAFPVVMLEAMAVSRPIVATRVGGIPEAIEHDVNGLLVEPEAPDAMATAIASLLRDPGHAAMLGIRARQTVCDRFDAAKVAQQYVDTYRRLTQGKEAPDAVVAFA
ncbi:MAG TPA: glycosyltransferase family 4 protein [Phycisphaerae bacterium]|nr:glycosyltransferase family 4 protein [Phycisphaerae bacterium]HRW52027.1 glycosyltransferase family 4 protein [Phycisphaerae bacterium]